MTAAEAHPVHIEEVRSLLSRSKTTKWCCPQAASLSSLALILIASTGRLCEVFQWKGETPRGLPDFSPKERLAVTDAICRVALYIFCLSDRCKIDLPRAALAKIALNEKKYPASLVRGKANKYSDYSHGSGGVPNQETEMRFAGEASTWSTDMTFVSLRDRLRLFVAERDWERYHEPRNLLLALVGEVGELCELVNLLKLEKSADDGDGHQPVWDGESKDKFSQEISDVFIYLTRLSDVCGVNLGDELRRRLLEEGTTQSAGSGL